MKKLFYVVVVLALFTVTFGGCASSKSKTPSSIDQENYNAEQEAQRGSEGGYTSGDSYYQESGSLGETHPDPVSTDTGSTGFDPYPDSNNQPAGQTMLGYRVQIVAMSTKEGALAEAQKAADLLNVAGYVEQIGGLWKVRIGNAKTRDDAETLRDYARNNGDVDAWIVETEISLN